MSTPLVLGPPKSLLAGPISSLASLLILQLLLYLSVVSIQGGDVSPQRVLIDGVSMKDLTTRSTTEATSPNKTKLSSASPTTTTTSAASIGASAAVAAKSSSLRETRATVSAKKHIQVTTLPSTTVAGEATEPTASSQASDVVPEIQQPVTPRRRKYGPKQAQNVATLENAVDDAREVEDEDRTEHQRARRRRLRHRHRNATSTTQPQAGDALTGVTPVASNQPSASTNALTQTAYPTDTLTTGPSDTGGKPITTATIQRTTATSAVAHEQPGMGKHAQPDYDEDDYYEDLPAIAPAADHKVSPDQRPGSLDGRSPGAAASLGRKIVESKTKNRPAPIMSSTRANATKQVVPSTEYKITPSLPSETPIVGSAGASSNLNESIYVQILNQTSENQVRSPLGANSTAHDLDWSKMVKVVFKKGSDNHTLYTLVMNSSELSNHPVNDWSSELPHLLQRDFEKLIQKWVGVFPSDHLMLDLGRIITEHISSMLPSYGNNTVANLTSLLGSKLNAIAENSDHNLTTDSTGNPSGAYGSSSLNNTMARLLLNHAAGIDANSSSFTTPSLNLSTEKASNASHIQANETSSTVTPSRPLIDLSTNASASNSSFTQENRLIGDGANNSATNIVEIIREMNSDHFKIKDNVKEQAKSLRQFITICSIAVVLATSLVLGIVIYLMRK